ncbi:MAG: SMC-Scp complex subunit ScpB [Deltaproteobacteria bacterium]|nr:SMC-Scp complex subunit ScpB [Deltaproteobacteria bacterium]
MPKSLKLIVEALLFASDKPLTARDVHAVLPDVKLPDITSALRVLKYEYEALGRSFSLKDVADGYQFRSHSEYGPYILTMHQSSPSRLSRASLETLAIIAYKQPILRQEIERLRGVDSGGILRTLLEKGLIRIVGRKNLPGRPLIYGTTKKFLEVFDLRDLESLPKIKEIKALGSDEDDLPPSNQPPLPPQGEVPQEGQGGAKPALDTEEAAPDQESDEPTAGETGRSEPQAE